MKLIIKTLFCIAIATSGYSQNISIEQLVSTSNKSTKNVIEYLSAHGWELIQHQVDPTNSKQYYYKFAYDKNANNDAAVAFFIIKSDTILKERTLQLRLFDVGTFNSYKKQLLSTGFKRNTGDLSDFLFSSSFINDADYLERDSNLCDVYSRKNVSIQLCTQVQNAHNTTTAVYVIRIRKS